MIYTTGECINRKSKTVNRKSNCPWQERQPGGLSLSKAYKKERNVNELLFYLVLLGLNTRTTADDRNRHKYKHFIIR